MCASCQPQKELNWGDSVMDLLEILLPKHLKNSGKRSTPGKEGEAGTPQTAAAFTYKPRDQARSDPPCGHRTFWEMRGCERRASQRGCGPGAKVTQHSDWARHPGAAASLAPTLCAEGDRGLQTPDLAVERLVHQGPSPSLTLALRSPYLGFPGLLGPPRLPRTL